MIDRRLSDFHGLCRNIDYRVPLESLLAEFRAERIADPDRTLEDKAIGRLLGGLDVIWDRLFPGFPHTMWKRRSVMWEYDRGRRDQYLRDVIAKHVPLDRSRASLIVNPATVFGRHAMSLAQALPEYEVVGTDIDVKPHQLYRLFKSLRYPRLTNYRYEIENVFSPHTEREPAAVVFFGACGSVTDGCMDYAIDRRAPFLICRSCCHDNIGGNTEIAKRPSWMYWGFFFKNVTLKWIKRQFPGTGFYFSDRHGPDAYPRSEAAREIVGSETLMDVARKSVESDICRSIVDLDRCLFLQENGYDVLYREELFFAHKRG